MGQRASLRIRPGVFNTDQVNRDRMRITDVGVRNYAVSHPEFPHESTSDQRFSESQLESYRALGFEMADAILAQALRGVDPS